MAERDRAPRERLRPKCCVWGSGRFGTAMAIVAARNGSEVCILTRRREVAEGINANHRNPSHLTDTTLPESISATTDAPTALANASIIIHCIPVQGSETFLGETQDLLSSIPRGCRIVCCSKGIETGNLEFMHQLLPRIMSKQLGVPFRRLDIEIAVLSGPTFAEQLALSQPSGVVIAARTHSLARECAWYFASSQMRVYPSTDIVGVEACGALKNVYALLAGGVEALDMHENTISLLTTRAGKEIARLAVAMGGKEHTMASVAGMGDLWLTTLGGSSRNKKVGYELASSGSPLKDILEERRQSLQGVAEGVYTAPAACQLARKLKVQAPLIETANGILEEKTKPRDAVERLMLKQTHPDRPVDLPKRRVNSVLSFMTGVLTSLTTFASMKLLRADGKRALGGRG